VADITLDSITGNITHIGGKKLPAAIPLVKWSEANQNYAQKCMQYIEESYKAQERFTEAVASSEILSLVREHSGNEILERLQEERGFNLVIVKPTQKWEEPGYEEPEAQGLVDINDLRRVEIVCIATDLLTKRLKSRGLNGRSDKVALTKAALKLWEIVEEVKRKLRFETTTNSRVKGVSGSDEDHITDNIGQFYIDAIPDILLQEGWKMYFVPVRGKSSSSTFLPEVNNHPYWESDLV